MWALGRAQVILTSGRHRPEAPSEVTANLKNSRAAFVDDFETWGGHWLDAPLLRRWSGGNKLTAARKNKGNDDLDPTFGLHILMNVVPKFYPRLSEPDLRRIVLLHFKLTYKDKNSYNPSDADHRLKRASIKREIQDHHF